MAGYIVNDVDKARGMGLDVLEFEEAEYAVVELTGSVPDCIHILCFLFQPSLWKLKYAVSAEPKTQPVRHSSMVLCILLVF